MKACVIYKRTCILISWKVTVIRNCCNYAIYFLNYYTITTMWNRNYVTNDKN